MGLLLAVAIFMLHGPPGVITAADNIKYPAINAFVRAFQQDQRQCGPDQDDWTDAAIRNQIAESRKRCVETATSIFQLADRRIAIPFVQAMAPPIIQYLLSDQRSRHSKLSESELALTLECVRSVEVLMTSPNLEMSSESKNTQDCEKLIDARAEQLLKFLIPVLISHLILPEHHEINSGWREKLNEKALAKITEVGQRWPQQFRQVHN